MNKVLTFNEFLAEHMQDPEFKAEWDALEPKSLSEMTKEEFDASLERGWQDAQNGRVRSLDEAFEKIRQMCFVKSDAVCER